MKFVEMAFHRCCTSVHFSIQPPARLHEFGDPGSVGDIKFHTLFRCADSFTLATHIPSSGQR